MLQRPRKLRRVLGCTGAAENEQAEKKRAQGSNPGSFADATAMLMLKTAGVVMAANVATGLIEGTRAYFRADKILRGFDNVLSGVRATESRTLRAEAGEQARIRGNESVLSMAESLPVIGAFVRLASAASGLTNSLEEAKLRSDRSVQFTQYALGQQKELRLREATLTGDPVKVIQEKQQQLREPAQKRVDELMAEQQRLEANKAQWQQKQNEKDGIDPRTAWVARAGAREQVEKIDAELGLNRIRMEEAQRALAAFGPTDTKELAITTEQRRAQLGMLRAGAASSRLQTLSAMAKLRGRNRDAFVLETGAEAAEMEGAFAAELAGKQGEERRLIIQGQQERRRLYAVGKVQQARQMILSNEGAGLTLGASEAMAVGKLGEHRATEERRLVAKAGRAMGAIQEQAPRLFGAEPTAGPSEPTRGAIGDPADTAEKLRQVVELLSSINQNIVETNRYG